MWRGYFTGCDLRKLVGEEFARVFACHLCGKTPLWEYDSDGLRDIDLECDQTPCRCASILKQWEYGWSKMPKRF